MQSAGRVCIRWFFACKSWKDKCQESLKGSAGAFESRLEQKAINLCRTQILSGGDMVSTAGTGISTATTLLSLAPRLSQVLTPAAAVLAKGLNA